MHLKVVSENDALNLSNLLKDGDWMVLYYAEWCGHCQSMKPEWEKTVSNLKNSGKVNIAEVKSDFIDKLENKPQIEGFPTIKMYNSGEEVAKFEDDRVADKMEKFALSNSKSKSKSNSASSKNEAKTLKTTLEKLIEHDASQKLINKLNNKLDNKLEDLELNHINQLNQTNEELPIMPINNNMIKQTIIPSYKSHHSSRKHTAKQHNMHRLSDILKKTSIHKTVKKTKQPAVKHDVAPIQKVNIPCNEIKKAKICKANSKCMFDYAANKCKSKLTNTISHKPTIKKNKSKSKNKNKSKSKSKRKSKSIKTIKKSVKSIKMIKNKNNSNNIKQSTKDVFDELIKSFGRISNETKKDSKLLSKISKKL